LELSVGGDNLIQAVLGGKSLGYEYTEDILTSTVFGTLKYLKPDMILIPFIESAFLYNEKRTTLWEKLNSEGIELRCYREVEYVFWTWNQNYGEPDLILIFRDHVHGFDDLLLVVEAKFKSGKSGTEENDQLVRYFEAINNDIENFTESSVSSFKGRKGYVVYLTEAEAYSDITATTKIIQSRYNEIKENVFHLRWHQLYKTLEKMYPHYSSFEKIIVDDLMKYMEKLGLRDFSGISLPDKSLNSAFLLPYPIFYNDGNSSAKKRTYFDQLNNLDITIEKNIFYRGNQYE
jgi:hypothetical protein